jgi:prefoldin subunit 5
MICDTIYSKAKVNKDINKVNLWLGANTMVEFTFEEAKKLLGKNLENAQNNLSTFVSFY